MVDVEQDNALKTTMDIRSLQNRMKELRQYFKMAMLGEDSIVEKTIRQSLELYAQTGCQEIVLLGLKLAYHTRNHDLAVQVFDAIFETSGDFWLLFSDLVFGLNKTTSEEVEEYEWYLKVASKKVFVCDNQNVAMVDVPYRGFTFAAYAASVARTTVLLMLLRHGADPVKATLLLRPPLDSEESATVLRLILRALPSPAPNLLKIEPGLVLAPKLKHLSKVAVRNLLDSNRSLPDGIYGLDVPPELKMYLDLRRDF